MSDSLKTKIELLKREAKGLSLLYVEDETELREKTASFFNKIFTDIDFAVDGLDAFEKYKNKNYDLIITDILMPNMNGLELIKKIRQKNQKQEIIITTAYTEFSYLTESIKFGVSAYLIKPLNLLDTLNTISLSLEKLRTFKEVQKYKNSLEEMVAARTAEVKELQIQQQLNYEYAIQSFIKMMEQRDSYTSGHSERVAKYSKAIAEKLGYNKEQCDLIYQAGILHDIGKILTPDSILLKPGGLNREEYTLIQNHVTSGYEILSEVPMYKHLANIVYSHHEAYDGSGYPRALQGDEIPIFARIMAIADAFDAMTTNRIYKRRKEISGAIEELKKFSGSRYDPSLIPAAIDVLQKVDLNTTLNQNPVSELDDARFSYFFKDSLTHIYNHEYLDFILQKNKNEKNFVCFNVIYLRKFSSYNKKYGWDGGDTFLYAFAQYLKSEFKDAKIFRIFGDDFLLIRDVHQRVDIDTINNSELLLSNNLQCDLKHLELQENSITNYRDLLKAID